MSEWKAPPLGAIVWSDLTVPNAEQIRDFYAAVTGWTFSGVDTGGREDYNMHRADGEIVAGICHALGVNADLPPVWLVYITVPDLDQSIKRCVEGGGEVIAGPKGAGADNRYCVIRDPAGAIAALFETKTE